MSVEVAKSISNNVTVLTGTRVITSLAGFVLMLFLPRYLGPDEYGALFLGNSIVIIGSIVIDFGGRYVISKAVSREPGSIATIIMNFSVLKIFLWIIASIGVVSFIYLADYSSTVRTVVLIYAFSMLWVGLREVLWSCYQGLEVMKYSSFGGIIESLFITAVGLVALMLGARAITVAVVMATGTLLNFLVCAHYARRYVSSLPPFDMGAAVRLLRTGIPYFLWSLFGAIYYRIDSLMLSLMAPQAVVGWYGAVYGLFDTLMFVPNILSVAIFPVLARLWKTENSTLTRTTKKSLDLVMIVGIPISIGVFAFSEQIIAILFGLDGYASSIILLKVFAVGLLLVYVDFIIGTTILAVDRQRHWSVVAFLAIIVNVVLNYLFIPYTQLHSGNGGVGAAIATIITEFFVMCAALSLLPRDFFAGAGIAAQVKSIVAGIIMAVVIYFCNKWGWHWIAQASIGSVVYCMAILSMQTLEPTEVSFIKNYLSPRNLKNQFVPDKKGTA